LMSPVMAKKEPDPPVSQRGIAATKHCRKLSSCQQ